MKSVRPHLICILLGLLQPLTYSWAGEDPERLASMSSLKQIRKLQTKVKIPLKELEQILKYRLNKMSEATGFQIHFSSIVFGQNPQSILDGAEALEHLLTTTDIFAGKTLKAILLSSYFEDTDKTGWLVIDASANLSEIKTFIERQSDQDSSVVHEQMEYAQILKRLGELQQQSGVAFPSSFLEPANRRRQLEKIEQLVRLEAFKGKFIKAFLFLNGDEQFEYGENGIFMVRDDVGIEKLLSLIADLPDRDDPEMAAKEEARRQIQTRLYELRQQTGGIRFAIPSHASLEEQQRLLALLEHLVAGHLFSNVEASYVGFGSVFDAGDDTILLNRNASLKQMEAFLRKGYHPGPIEVRMENPIAFDGRIDQAIDNEPPSSTCANLLDTPDGA